MNVGTLSPQQLRSLVEDKWQRDDEALALGLHVTSMWQGPAEVEFEFGRAKVVHADTVFQVRDTFMRGNWCPSSFTSTPPDVSRNWARTKTRFGCSTKPSRHFTIRQPPSSWNRRLTWRWRSRPIRLKNWRREPTTSFPIGSRKRCLSLHRKRVLGRSPNNRRTTPNVSLLQGVRHARP